ncbi:unannotated protein [freshwater metagenome]|uniref:Unannotated protein n=1 Tax=freshwater metagenome TaxID=449393 RepID=A0A6J7TIA0_9ZZZZ
MTEIPAAAFIWSISFAAAGLNFSISLSTIKKTLLAPSSATTAGRVSATPSPKRTLTGR